MGGAGIPGGGPSCAQHMSPGSPRPSPRARGWEQLATGRPLNKEPLSSVRVCPARSGQLTLPGMPRPAPSVAYRGPRGGGTAGPGALGSVWGAPAPATGAPPGQGRAARTPSGDLALVARTPGSSGGVVWRPRPPLLWAPRLPGEILFIPEHTGVLLTREAFEGPGAPARGPPAPELASCLAVGLPGST